MYSNWNVTTWSNRVLFCNIQKHGTDADKARLSPPTSRNQKHREKRTMSQSNYTGAVQRRRNATTVAVRNM